MLLRQIFDPKLAAYTYLIGCQRTGEALLIDPQRDVDRYLTAIAAEGLRLTAVAETHIHADFLSGARQLAETVPGIRLYLSDEGDECWKSEWARSERYPVTLLHDGDTFEIGAIEIRALHTPGHTPEHLSYLVTDRGGGADEPMGIASGDFVFVGDLGRPDLLESAAKIAGAGKPSARRLFASAQRFLELPDHLQVWPAHGAGSACGKALGAVPQSTVGYERRFSRALQATRGSEDAFVDFILAGQPAPPLYFARMKQLNKEGVPRLDRLPEPAPLSPEILATLADRRDVAVLDTRDHRDEFMAGHLPGALHTPLHHDFLAAAGSYVTPERPIVLIVERKDVEEAVRALVRIGLDEVTGFATPAALATCGRLIATESVPAAEIEDRVADSDGLVLDVRSHGEHAAGHLEGSVNVPHTRLPEHLDELPRDRRLFIHCASGARAAAAASLLEREGFAVTHVDGNVTSRRTVAAVGAT